MRDPEFETGCERLHAKVLEQLAPAIEGPIVNPGKRSGRLIFGDASD